MHEGDNSTEETALVDEIRLAYSQKDMAKTELLARTALAAYENAKMSYYLCAALYCQRHYSEARVLLSQLLEEYPGYFSAWNLLALIEYKESGPDKAVQTLERAIELGMDRGTAYLTIGQFLLDDGGMYSEAIDAYKNVPRDSKSYLDSLIKSAYAYRRMYLRGKASKCLDLAATLDPDNVELKIEKAELLIDQRRFSEARKAIDSLIESVGINLQLECCLCRLDTEQKRFDSAAAHMSNAISIAPHQARLYANRASALILARKFKAAEEDIKRAEELGDTRDFLIILRFRLRLRQFRLIDAAKELANYIRAARDGMDRADKLRKLQAK